MGFSQGFRFWLCFSLVATWAYLQICLFYQHTFFLWSAIISCVFLGVHCFFSYVQYHSVANIFLTFFFAFFVCFYTDILMLYFTGLKTIFKAHTLAAPDPHQMWCGPAKLLLRWGKDRSRSSKDTSVRAFLKVAIIYFSVWLLTIALDE